jgi:hypothetical protein
MAAMEGPDSATLLRRYRHRGRLTQQDLAKSARARSWAAGVVA